MIARNRLRVRGRRLGRGWRSIVLLVTGGLRSRHADKAVSENRRGQVTRHRAHLDIRAAGDGQPLAVGKTSHAEDRRVARDGPQ